MDVMEGSFAKWNVLQAAHPCFRTGLFNDGIESAPTKGLDVFGMVALTGYRVAV
jgi:hypothetical protein